MREILFRGKRIDNGEWVEGQYIRDIRRYNESLAEYTYKIQSLLYKMAYAHPVNPETICQYTGLVDKNGKKIFEGDIVKTFLCIDDHNESLYEYGKIIYDANNAAFLISCDAECLLEIRIWGNIEVIGNIFDNPELLE